MIFAFSKKNNRRLALGVFSLALSGCVNATTTAVNAVSSSSRSSSSHAHSPRIPSSTRYRVVDKIVKKDADIMLAYWQSVDENCNTQKFQVIKLEKSPLHGNAYFTELPIHPSFPASNPRSQCNSKAINATTLHYKPAANFSGFDIVPVTVASPMGAVMNVAFRIRVVD